MPVLRDLLLADVTSDGDDGVTLRAALAIRYGLEGLHAMQLPSGEVAIYSRGYIPVLTCTPDTPVGELLARVDPPRLNRRPKGLDLDDLDIDLEDI